MSALTGFRIVELAESVAGEYCGKLLADFGAEVIKVERPGGGSPTRAMAPYRSATGAEPEGSGTVRLSQHQQAVRRARPDHRGRGRTPARAHRQRRRRHRRPRPRWLEAGLAGRVSSAPECGVLLDHPVWPGCAARRWNAKSINVFHASGWGYHTPSHADPGKPPLKGRAGSWSTTRPGWMPRCASRGTVTAAAHRPRSSSSTFPSRP